MTDDFVKRDEHQEAMQRVHTRVDAVEKSTSSIDTSAKIMSDCVSKMEKVMFGDQNASGIVTKVSLLHQKVSGVYWLGSVIIIAFIGALVGLIFKK